MVDDHATDESKSSAIYRRPALQMLGGIMGLSVLSTSGIASSVDAQTEEVVDLGEKGLTNGDVIDDYLEEYFVDGVEVRVPEGEYAYHGDGFGGRYSEAAVVGDGEVILTNEAGVYRETIAAHEGGTVLVKNFTLRGAVPDGDRARIRLEANSDGRVVIDNFNLPDGNVDGANANGYYLPPEHAGVVEIRNCYIANFSNNGIYASAPGKGEDGQVVVENCVSHNNNIAGIRLGSSNSVARNCLVLNDGPAPTGPSWGRNMRGIRIREPGSDLRIEGCEIINSYEGAGGPIVHHEGGEGGSGTITDVRIRNDSDTDAILEKGTATENWSAENVSITGDGDLSYPSHFSGVDVGDDAEEPTGEDPQNTDGSTDDGTDDSGSDDSGSDGSGDADDDTTRLAYVTGEGAPEQDYALLIEGNVEPITDESYETPAGNYALATSNFEIETLYGDVKHVHGYSGNGWGDGYEISGQVLEATLYGEDSWFELDGERLSPDELVAQTGGPTSGDGTTDSDGSGGSDSEDHEKILLVDGTETGSVTSYAFAVTGEVERDAGLSSVVGEGTAWDTLEDDVDGNRVVGTVGKGIDGYRYTGNVVELQFDGQATVTVDDS